MADSTQSRAPDTDASPTARVFTCPMQPEVREPEPGDCPKCGMALEPVVTPLTQAAPGSTP